VPRKALACPDCGADENTGWNEEATRYDGLDLPEDLHEQADSASAYSRTGTGARIGRAIVAIIVTIALLAYIIKRLRLFS
jgi:hypothetical protein